MTAPSIGPPLSMAAAPDTARPGGASMTAPIPRSPRGHIASAAAPRLATPCAASSAEVRP